MGKVTYMKDGKVQMKKFGTEKEGQKIREDLKKEGATNLKFEW
jgi:hypothetical protein